MGERATEQKVVSRKAVIGVGIVCVVLLGGLVGTVANYSLILNVKDTRINDLEAQLCNQNSQMSDLHTRLELDESVSNSLAAQKSALEQQVAAANATVAALNSQIAHLKNTTMAVQGDNRNLHEKISSLSASAAGNQSLLS